MLKENGFFESSTWLSGLERDYYRPSIIEDQTDKHSRISDFLREANFEVLGLIIKSRLILGINTKEYALVRTMTPYAVVPVFPETTGSPLIVLNLNLQPIFSNKSHGEKKDYSKYPSHFINLTQEQVMKLTGEGCQPGYMFTEETIPWRNIKRANKHADKVNSMYAIAVLQGH